MTDEKKKLDVLYAKTRDTILEQLDECPSAAIISAATNFLKHCGVTANVQEDMGMQAIKKNIALRQDHQEALDGLLQKQFEDELEKQERVYGSKKYQYNN